MTNFSVEIDVPVAFMQRGVESGIDGLYAESLNCRFIVVLLRPMSIATFQYCELVKFCKIDPSMFFSSSFDKEQLVNTH